MGATYEKLTSYNAPEGLITDALPPELLKEICSRWIPDFDKYFKDDPNGEVVIEHGVDIKKLAGDMFSELLLAAEIPASQYALENKVNLQDLWNLIYTLESMSCASASNVVSWNPVSDGVKPGLLFTPWRNGQENTVFDEKIDAQFTEGAGGKSYQQYVNEINDLNAAADPEQEARNITRGILKDILAASAMDEPSNLYEETFPARLKKDIKGTKRWGGVMTLASPFESDTPTFSGSPLVKSVKYTDEAFKAAALNFLSHETDILDLYTVIMHDMAQFIEEQRNPDYLDKYEGNRRNIQKNLIEDVPRYSSFYKFVDADLWKPFDYIMRDFRMGDDSDFLLGRLPAEMTGVPDTKPSLYAKNYFDISRGEPRTGASAASPIPDMLNTLRSEGINEGVNADDPSNSSIKSPKLSDGVTESDWTSREYVRQDFYPEVNELYYGLNSAIDGCFTPHRTLSTNKLPDDERMLLPNQFTDTTYAPAKNLRYNNEEIIRKCKAAKASWDIFNKYKKALSLCLAERALQDLNFHVADLKAEFGALKEMFVKNNLSEGGYPEKSLQEVYEDYRVRYGYELNKRPPKQRFFVPEVFYLLEPKDYTIEIDVEKLAEVAKERLFKQKKKEITSAVSKKEAESHVKALALSLHTLVAYAVDTIEGRDPLLSWAPDILSSIRSHTVNSVMLTGTPNSEASKEIIANASPEEVKKLDYTWKPDILHEKFKFGKDNGKLTTYSELNEFEKSIQAPNFSLFTDKCDDMSLRQLMAHGMSGTPLAHKETDDNAYYVLAPKIMKWRLRHTGANKSPLRTFNGDTQAARRAVVEFVLEFCRNYAKEAASSDLNNWNDKETAEMLDAAEASKEARERLMYTAGGAWHMDTTAVYHRGIKKLTQEEKEKTESAVEAELAEVVNPDLSNVQPMIDTENKRLKEYYNFVYNIVPKYRGRFDKWYLNDPWMMIPEMSSMQAAQLCPGHYNIMDAASRLMPLLRVLSVPKSPISGLRLYDMNMLSGELLLYMRDRRLMDFLYDPDNTCLNLSGGYKRKHIDARWLGRRYAHLGDFSFPDEFAPQERSVSESQQWGRMYGKLKNGKYGILPLYDARRFDPSGYFHSNMLGRPNQWFVHSFKNNPTVLPTAQEKIFAPYYGNFAGALPCTAAMLDNMMRIGVYGRYRSTAAVRSHIASVFSPSYITQTDRIKNWSLRDADRLVYCDPQYDQDREDYMTTAFFAYLGPLHPKYAASVDMDYMYTAYETKHRTLKYSALSGRYAFLPLMHSLRRYTARELYIDTYMFPVRGRTYECTTKETKYLGSPEYKTTPQYVRTNNYTSPFDVRCENYTDDPVTLERVKFGPQLAAATVDTLKPLKEEIVKTVENNRAEETLITRSGPLRYKTDGANWESARMRCLTQDIAYSVNKLRREADPNCAPMIGIYSTNPLMRTRQKEERAEEISDTTQMLILNAKRYYGGFVSVIDKSRYGYDHFKKTLQYGSDGVGSFYSAWQAAFLYNSAWLNSRFENAADIYNRHSVEWRQYNIPGVRSVWRKFGMSALTYRSEVGDGSLPRDIDGRSGPNIGAFKKPQNEMNYDENDVIRRLDTYGPQAEEQIRRKPINAQAGARSRSMVGGLVFMMGTTPLDFYSSTVINDLTLQSRDRRDAPLIDVMDSHLYNPGSLALKFSGDDNPADIDFYSIYRDINKPWGTADPAKKLKDMKERVAVRSEMFHRNISYNEFAMYWNKEYDKNSYYCGDEGAFKSNFCFPTDFGGSVYQGPWLYNGIGLDYQPPLSYPRTCYNMRHDYQNSVLLTSRENKAGVFISETLSEISPEDGRTLPVFKFRLPGYYNLTPHGCDNFSYGDPIAVITDWSTLEKKRITARTPREAADIAEKNYRDCINIIYPKLEPIERSYANSLNDFTMAELKELYGQELAHKMDAARRSRFAHVDYFPTISEIQMLSKCIDCAQEKAQEKLESARYDFEKKTLSRVSIPKVDNTEYRKPYDDRPPVWVSEKNNSKERSGGIEL